MKSLDPRDRLWLLRDEPISLRDLASCVDEQYYVYNCAVIGKKYAQLIVWAYNEERKRPIWRLRRAGLQLRAFWRDARDIWTGRQM